MAELTGVFEQDYLRLTKWTTQEQGAQRVAELDALLASGQEVDERYAEMRPWMAEMAGVADAPDGSEAGAEPGDELAGVGVGPAEGEGGAGLAAPAADDDGGGAPELAP